MPSVYIENNGFLFTPEEYERLKAEVLRPQWRRQYTRAVQRNKAGDGMETVSQTEPVLIWS